MTKTDTINIVITPDNNYIQHAGVMLYSLMKSVRNTKKVAIFIVNGGIDKQNKIIILKILSEFKVKPKFIEINKKVFSGLKTTFHFNQTIYYRIIIPEILNSLEKILYLDCDMVVRKDIRQLWNTNLGNKIIAAVQDPQFDRYSELEIPVNCNYFNAGVLLIDIQRWIYNDTTCKVLTYLRQKGDSIIFGDQDGLNGVLFDKWKKLSPVWNQQRSFFLIKYKDTKFNKSDFEKSKSNPAIIHYTSGIKPWQYIDCHPFKNEYYRNLKMTPWKRYEPSGITLVNIMKKSIWRLIWKFVYMAN